MWEGRNKVYMSDSKGLLLNNFKKKDESDEAEKIIEVITKILKAIHLKNMKKLWIVLTSRKLMI